MREPGVISTLRNIVPLRPLTREEALRIAERQALMLLRIAGITQPDVPEVVISELPRLRVARLSPLPISGAAHWAQGQWLIVLNASEPAVRQRFSLAHEFKHVARLERRPHTSHQGRLPAGPGCRRRRSRWMTSTSSRSTTNKRTGVRVLARPATPDLLPDPHERPVISAEEAFAALGIDRSTGYKAIRDQTFPVPVIRVGRIIRIPTLALRRLLLLDGDPPSSS
jgi:predicted DNA-binding transcriptional regulator AlpA